MKIKIRRHQHAFLKKLVSFHYTGSGTNVQWVFVVQGDEEKGIFESVPSNFPSVKECKVLTVSWW